MENKDSKRPEDINNILAGLSSDDATVVITEGADDGKLEFRFDSNKKLGLVFEDTDHREGGLHFESDTPIEDASAPRPAVESTSEEPSTEPLKEEFSIPDNFDVAETTARVDESTRVWSTYVPRFTEVSETYRMSDDPRPRPEKVEKTVVASEEVKPAALDPTDESIENAADVDAVLVNLGQKPEAEEQSFSIYKFSDGEPKQEPEQRERTVEDERAEIEILFQKKEAPKQEDPAPEEEPPRFKRIEPTEKPKSYNLPDPEHDRRVQVVDYAETAAAVGASDAPSGADDTPVTNGKKRKVTEFTAHMQRDSFKDKFLDSIISARVRLVASIILCMAMLLFENAELFNFDVIGYLGLTNVPAAMAIADLQFALCIFVLALPELARAMRAIARGTLSPELSLLPSVLVLIAYTVVLFIEFPPQSYPLFGSLVAVQGIAAILGTCCKRGADFLAFKRASAAGEKKILDKRLTRSLERENLALDGAVDEIKSKTARIFKTTFVSDFFKRASTSVEDKATVIISLAVSLVAAIAGGIVAFFIGNGWLDAATVFAAIALLTMPASLILSHKLSFYHASLECDSEESAIIGESTIYEYSGVDVIAFEDTDIFGTDDVNLKRIIHYGNVDNMMKAMRQMSAIFSCVGGPLDVIFANALDRKCSPATAPVIEQDGISGMVDGHRVSAGTSEYMIRHGITLPAGAESSRSGVFDSTKVMYGAEDGIIYVQFHIRYSFSEEFTMILPTLKKEKIVPLVYTRDPNISGELMKTLTSGDDCIRVMKKHTSKLGENKIYRRISAGIVTSGDKLDAIGVILLTKKYVRLMKTLSILGVVATATGCALAIALAIAGMLGISSVALFGWQLIWCLVIYIVSRKSFGLKKKEENYDDE